LSMENLAKWHREIAKTAPKASFCVVGSKIDLHRVAEPEAGDRARKGLTVVAERSKRIVFDTDLYLE